MVDSSMLSAATKLVTASLPAAPGPMLGDHGRLDPSFVQDEGLSSNLQDALDDFVDHQLPAIVDPLHPTHDDYLPHKKDYAFAIVDLTDGAHPAYAGSNDTNYMYVASLAKILPLYAAYQLRVDIRTLSTAIGSTDLGLLATEARLRYGSMDASTSTSSLKLPQIETFFTVDAAGRIDFAFDDKSDADLETAYQNRPLLSMLKAREHLRLMSGWSDNIAATLVIRAIGFKYLWSLTKRSGLYRMSWNRLTRHATIDWEPSGLFFGRDYDGRYWGDGPEERNWITTPPKRPSQAACARSIAYLMTMLGLEKLIDHEAHCGMFEMLRKDSSFVEPTHRGEFSPIGAGMNQAGWTAAQPVWNYKITSPPASDLPNPTMSLAVSKIGLAAPDKSNVLLVRTPVRGVTITAVLVAIDNNPTVGNWTVCTEFGKEMALKLEQLHGAGP
jgi:hypothetical protein